MGKWVDIKGPVVADTVYSDNVLVAKDTSFTLPGIEFLTADVQAMGTMTKIGVDNGLSRLNRLEKQNLEFRWVQSVISSDGSQSTEGCKAFVRTLPSNIPEIGVEVGNATEIEATYNVTRLQIYANGVEVLCVDRLNQILRVNGKDYYQSIDNLL